MPASISQILGLPYIQPSQAQKHVTHNEALRLIDVLVQLVVNSHTIATPPASPPNGTRHIVPTGATGDWAGQDGDVAIYWDSNWVFVSPEAGWQSYVKDEDGYVTYQNGAWAAASGDTDHQNLDLVGVNTTADTSNRLSVSSDNTLLSHDGDDHRVKVNKAATADTASLLFQNAFSGRAEMGLAGSDAFDIKVSANGSAWNTAMAVDGATGTPAMPQGLDVSSALTGSGVVGTASQAGGVSTGAIIEQGSNANGSYIRWADGTQICYDNDFEISASNQSLVDAAWTLPIPMFGTYTVTCTLPYFAANWSVNAERNNVSAIVSAATNNTTARAGYYPITTPVTVTVSKCCVAAFGRWY